MKIAHAQVGRNIQNRIPLPSPNPNRAAIAAPQTNKNDTAKLSSKARNLLTHRKRPQQAPLSLSEGEFLRRGSRGPKVKQLQELLSKHGFETKADGVFGPRTRRALRRFQRQNKLSRDGVVGEKTLAALHGTEPPKRKSKIKKPEAGNQTESSASTGRTGRGRFANTRQSLNKLPKPLRKYADTFQAAGEKYGIDPRFLAAISMHETGNGRSSAFRNKNNAMGISGRRGPLHQKSVESSIYKMARTLAKPRGYYRNRTTIGGVGKVYAPIGAANDPTGLNGHWAKGVARNFRRFGGNPTQKVIFR